MDSNTNEPREGSQRGDKSRQNGGRGQNHKFHQRRRPNDAAQYEESSPNGSITVKPGRYDLPPSADSDGGAIIRNGDRREPRQQDERRPDERRPRPEKKRPEKRHPDDRRNDQKQRQPDATAQDQQKQERQKPRPQNQDRRRNEQKKQESQRQDQPEQSEQSVQSEQSEWSDGQNPQNKPKRPRRRRPKNHNGQRPDAVGTDAQTADENTSAPDSAEERAIPDETPEQSDERPANRPAQEQKKRPQKSRRGRNRRSGAREEQKNLSAAEIDDISEEEAAISEYIAVAGAAGNDEPSEAEIIEELNSVETADVPDDTAATEDAYAADMAETEDVRTEYIPEPPAQVPTIEVIGVRFKSGGKIYYFDPDGMRFLRNDPVIVDTARGMEFGTVELQNRMVTEREVVLPLRKVVRRATDEDVAKADENRRRAEEALDVCAKKIAEHGLDMKLVDVEYAFDNSKLLFYFTADGRVDFRELVKDLAAVFRTRIELRQIGIRDETKLLGGIGICGRPFCCKTFLSDFVQVSIKMAKEQNLSLNSVKISGACGRLMCCLRYEYDTYQEEIRRTPKVDQIVSTPDGDGIVTEVQPLAGLVRVRFTDKPDAAPKVFHRDNVTVIGQKSKGPRQQERQDRKDQQPKDQSSKPQRQRRDDQRQKLADTAETAEGSAVSPAVAEAVGETVISVEETDTGMDV